MLDGIKGVVFDVENVLRDGEIRDIPDHFEKVGVDATKLREALNDPAKLPSFFRDCRIGKIGAAEFRKLAKATLLVGADKLSDAQFDECYCGVFKGLLYKDPFEVVKKLRARGIKTVILSNNNPIHTAYFLKQCDEVLGVGELSKLFEATLFSYQIGCRKPDKEAFQKAIDACKALPSECLMVDDKDRNLKAAQELGMKILKVASPLDVAKKLLI